MGNMTPRKGNWVEKEIKMKIIKQQNNSNILYNLIIYLKAMSFVVSSFATERAVSCLVFTVHSFYFYIYFYKNFFYKNVQAEINQNLGTD